MQNAMDFEGMMRMLSALPLWVKQIIYTQLRIDLETTLSKRTLDMFGPDDLLQLLVPELTTVGNKELDHPSGYHSQDLLRFLHLCRQKKTIAKEFAGTLERVAKKPKESTYLVIDEVERENWAKGEELLG